MKRIYNLPGDELVEGLYRGIYLLIKKNRGYWATRGATFGLTGGMLAIVMGALLWALDPLLEEGNFRSFMNVSETVFFVLPLPLLALSACCLDLLEKRTPILPLPFKSQPARLESLHRLRPRRTHHN